MPTAIKADLIREDTIDLLHKFQILKTLSREEIKGLLGKDRGDYQNRIARLIRCAAEETVIREGEFDCWTFWVVKGSFAVIKNDITIAVFNHPGEVFGEMSILDGDCRSASVVAQTDGVCLSIDMSVLDNLEHSELKAKISDRIHRLKSERLNLTTNKLVEEKTRIAAQMAEIEKEKQRLTDWKNMLKEKEQALIRREKQVNKKSRQTAPPPQNPAS
ncbi:MAG: cyclic nucleotide-binding domain-containing protein [Thermodesulfobacteriota bacterium]|nr:cyclic nucleotide-binding domain-containing protein [Thermodesulfobacteriota bacterium]